MENANGRPILNDLALIYLAMAHGTDEQLSDEEIKAMADRLHQWQQVDSKTVVGALKLAAEEYLNIDVSGRLKQAVYNVRQQLPLEQRQGILDDLMNIALSDDRFMHRESTFIGELMRAWEISPSTPVDGEAPVWSVLTQTADDRRRWTLLHDLAIVYLTLAQRTDDDLSEAEVNAISEKLHEWMPDARAEDALQVVRDALAVYVQGPDERVFAESVAAVGENVPLFQLAAILDDLRHVASADGRTSNAETRLIDRLVRTWNVPAA